MNNPLQIAQFCLSSFVFGAIVCIIFIFRPTIEGLIAQQTNEATIRMLEKLKLDTWINFNRWAMICAIALLVIQCIQFFTDSVSPVRILINCILFGLLVWNQVIDTKLFNLTDSVPASAIVTDRGDKTWEFYHDQAPPIGVFITLTSTTILVMQILG
jgi:hypothetical protein